MRLYGVTRDWTFRRSLGPLLIRRVSKNRLVDPSAFRQYNGATQMFLWRRTRPAASLINKSLKKKDGIKEKSLKTTRQVTDNNKKNNSFFSFVFCLQSWSITRGAVLVSLSLSILSFLVELVTYRCEAACVCYARVENGAQVCAFANSSITERHPSTRRPLWNFSRFQSLFRDIHRSLLSFFSFIIIYDRVQKNLFLFLFLATRRLIPECCRHDLVFVRGRRARVLVWKLDLEKKRNDIRLLYAVQ